MLSFKEAVDAVIAGGSANELESDSLEYKQEDGSIKHTLEVVADAVVCLANASGGMVILGVADSGRGSGAILGVGPRISAEVLARGIFDRTQPPLSVPITKHEVEGKVLWEISVPVGVTFYSNAKGTATRRVGAECRPFSADQQRQALAARGLEDWSAAVTNVRAVSDAEMERLRNALRRAGLSEIADRDTTAILRDLRLASNEGRLTRAGVLLVGRPEDLVAEVPAAEYSYQYRPSPGAESTRRLRERRPLLAAIEEVIDAVGLGTTVHPLNVAGGTQLQLSDYPGNAVRELVVNAFVHRDYEYPGSVDVEQSPEQLRVTSPGPLVFGVTPQNILTHPSTPRNRLLLETIATLRIAERTGQGLDRAYRELLRDGKRPPVVIDDGTTVAVSIAGGAGNESFARYVHSHLDPALGADVDVLLALDSLRTQRRISAMTLAPVVQRAVLEVQQVLERLRFAGVVAPTKRTAVRAFPNYELSRDALTGLGMAVTYHRRVGDGDEIVAEHLREYGYITNQTVRRLFDMDVYQARDRLRDLVARGVIEKSPGAKRGPAVKYVSAKSRRS